MSLLMEALRKAEEAKRRMQQEEQQAAAGKEVSGASAVPPAGTNPSRSSASAFTLEEREPDVTPDYIVENFTGNQDQPSEHDDDELEPAPAPEPEYAAQSPPEPEPGARTLARWPQQRAAAASIFVAKQNPARNRKTLTILVIVMVLMIPLGGGVLWYLQTAARPSIGINPAVASYDLSSRGLLGENPPASTAAVTPAAVVGAAPAPEAVVVLPEQPAPTTERVTVNEPTAAAPGVTAPPIPTPEATVAVIQPPQTPIVAPAADTEVAADTRLTLPEASPNSVLEVSRSSSTREVNPGLLSAYARLQAGDLLVAGQLYQEVLNELPNNRDALLGLALVRVRQQELVPARELYARALQLNPRDPLAHTGLLQIMQVTNPTEHEATLRTLIGEYPDVAQLNFALGNLYASQQRWSEAQGAYYNALLTASRGTGGPVHPDYAFNLAVSLEQLNQKKAALDYYRQAQVLARDVAPGFDPQQLSSRLAYLEQDQP